MHLQGCGHTWRLLDHSTSSSLRHLLLLSLALREQMGLLALSADFQAHQPRGASEYSKGRPLLESLSLGIQQKGKRRANAGQDPRALCVKSYWWEKHALGRPSRRRVVAMANNPPGWKGWGLCDSPARPWHQMDGNPGGFCSARSETTPACGDRAFCSSARKQNVLSAAPGRGSCFCFALLVFSRSH